MFQGIQGGPTWRTDAEEDAADSVSGLSPAAFTPDPDRGARGAPPAAGVVPPLPPTRREPLIPLTGWVTGTGGLAAPPIPWSLPRIAHWERSLTSTTSAWGAPSRMLFRSSSVSESLSSAAKEKENCISNCYSFEMSMLMHAISCFPTSLMLLKYLSLYNLVETLHPPTHPRSRA